MIKKTKQKYEEPSMEEFEFEQLPVLLAGSDGFTGNRDDPYGTPEDPWSE